jgi:hypothetical protein
MYLYLCRSMPDINHTRDEVTAKGSQSRSVLIMIGDFKKKKVANNSMTLSLVVFSWRSGELRVKLKG